jgi:hypothetical protein
MSASSSSGASSRGTNDSPRGAVGGNIAAVEDKVEKVERDIAEVKAKIALFEAYASLNTFDAAADLDEFAAFARGNRARQRNALEVHLAQALPQRADALRELQGTLKELQRKENALRDEKARLETGATTAAASMFKLHLELLLSSETHSFRIALWQTLQARNSSVAGTCSRVGRVVTVNFFFETPGGSHEVKGILKKLFREYCNADPPTIEAPASLEEALAAMQHLQPVPQDFDVLGIPWSYSPESDKRSPHASPCKRPCGGGDDAAWADPPAELRRKTPTGSSRSRSSDNKQRAHILFENKHQEGMKHIIKLADELCGTKRTEEERSELLAELCRLTHDLDYNVHQDLDNLRFFWSWRLSTRVSDGAWQVELSPKYATGGAADNELLPQLKVFGPIEDVNRGKWVQALVIRKYLVYMLKVGKYNPMDLKEEWGVLPNHSECWKLSSGPATPQVNQD